MYSTIHTVPILYNCSHKVRYIMGHFLDVCCSIGSRGAVLEAQLQMGAGLTRNLIDNCRYICTIFSIFFMFSGKVLAIRAKHFIHICNI